MGEVTGAAFVVRCPRCGSRNCIFRKRSREWWCRHCGQDWGEQERALEQERMSAAGELAAVPKRRRRRRIRSAQRRSR
jgi:hypothetical protein